MLVLEHHHGAARDRVRLAGFQSALQLERRVRVAPREAALPAGRPPRSSCALGVRATSSTVGDHAAAGSPPARAAAAAAGTTRARPTSRARSTCGRRRDTPATASARGNRTCRSLAKRAPKPAGVKVERVAVGAATQRPGTLGESDRPLRAEHVASGFENVSCNGSSGLIFVSGAGLARRPAREPAGTTSPARPGRGAPSFAPRRRLATEPPGRDGQRHRRSRRCDPAVTDETALTAESNRTRGDTPGRAVSHRCRTRADRSGDRKSLVPLLPERPAQPARPPHDDRDRDPLARRQPRRRRQAPAADLRRDRRDRPPPFARTSTSEPANGCSSTRASADGSPARVAPDHRYTPPAAAAIRPTTTASAISARRRGRRECRRGTTPEA